MTKTVVFIDAEISVDDNKICDLGAVKDDRTYFHSASIRDFISFISGAEFICGHNIVHHDLKYIRAATESNLQTTAIDTLYLSPLLFPKRPYHALLKDDKLQVEELNNPVNDCKKAANLFYDEVNAFFALPSKLKQIFCYLISLILSILWNFTLNRKYTFKAAVNVPEAMAKVFGFYLVFTPLSTYLGNLAENRGGNDFLILAVTMLCNFVLEFLFCKIVVYRGKENTLQ